MRVDASMEYCLDDCRSLCAVLVVNLGRARDWVCDICEMR